MIYDVRTEDLTRSLPLPLLQDGTELAIAKAVAEQLIITANLAEKAVIYARINELDEAMLDTLAEDMHVDWYEADAPIETKRSVILDSVKVHKRLGTKWAVEKVVAAYFGECEVTEWFEYGGEPGYFRIKTFDLFTLNSLFEKFMRLLEKVKRKTAWLESITIQVNLSGDEYHGAFVSSYAQNHVYAEFGKYKSYGNSYHGGAFGSSYGVTKITAAVRPQNVGAIKTGGTYASSYGKTTITDHISPQTIKAEQINGAYTSTYKEVKA